MSTVCIFFNIKKNEGAYLMSKLHTIQSYIRNGTDFDKASTCNETDIARNVKYREISGRIYFGAAVFIKASKQKGSNSSQPNKIPTSFITNISGPH